jgi:DNA-directed RNA polymerase III subunit RPC2
MIFYGLI